MVDLQQRQGDHHDPELGELSEDQLKHHLQG